jgi:hypothetical protein
MLSSEVGFHFAICRNKSTTHEMVLRSVVMTECFVITLGLLQIY